ncbi:MAG: tetratricopeptide repeat protein [Bacteroidia bacterium]
MRKKAPPSLPKQTTAKAEAAAKQKAILHPNYFLAGIIILVAFIYSNALHGNILTFDDNEYFSNYPEVTHLAWKSIKGFFTNYYVIMYQPLPVMSFAINYHFSELNTFPLHLVNLIFHLANIFLIYKFIKLLTGNITIALIVALLFGIHPMNVEAVSWISARSSSMYTFFYLLALIYYLKFLKEQQLKNIILTGLFFILSLFSKAQAVTLPVLLLLLDFYLGRKLLSKKVILEKIPFFLLSILFGIITLMNSSTMKNIAEGMLISYSAVDIFFIACYSFVFYLFKFILPVNLCSIYVYPPKNGSLLPWEYYAAAILFLLLLFLVYKARRNKQVILCAGLFLITIAINIQLIPSRLFIVADRYAYFPYIGLYLLPLFFIIDVKEKKKYFFNKYYPYLISLFIFYIAFFTFSVVKRNLAWQNDISLLSDIIAKNPAVDYIARAYGNRGLAYEKLNMHNEAISDYTEAVKLKPDEGRTYYNRGLAYLRIKDNISALADFNMAAKIDSGQSLIYSSRSQIKFMLNDMEGTIADCKKCLELDSENIDCYNTLANVDFSKKDYISCEQHLTLALKHKPDFSIAFKNRGLLYLQLNRKADACSDFLNGANLRNEEAIQLYNQYCK